MAFQYITEEPDMNTKITAAVDLYSNDDGDLVEAGQDARLLVARAGRFVPLRYSEKVTEGGRIKKASKPKSESKPKARKPPANKKRKQGDDK